MLPADKPWSHDCKREGMQMNEMVKVYRMNDHNGEGGFIVDDPQALVDELRAFEADEDGPAVFIFVEQMDRKSLENLPEFDGF
jgi:hypothetical protein